MNSYDENALWVTFRLDSQFYCVSSFYVDSILIPPVIPSLPGAPHYLKGLIPYGGAMLPVVDLRTLFGMLNLSEYIDRFSEMKQLHVSWVEALELSVRDNIPFTKPVDPHKCQFGQWYDHYQTDNHSLNFILKQIEEPHAEIHRCGALVNQYLAEGHRDRAQAVLEQARRLCRDKIIPLLDRLIDTYREVNQGILLILRNKDCALALLVDEISTLISIQDSSPLPLPTTQSKSEYLHQVVKKGERVFLEVYAPAILLLCAATVL